MSGPFASLLNHLQRRHWLYAVTFVKNRTTQRISMKWRQRFYAFFDVNSIDLSTVSWGQFIPRQKYKKTIPGKILKLVSVLGLRRSGKAKKVDVSLRPREIMAKNQIAPNWLKWTLNAFISWPWNEFQRVHKTPKGVPSNSGWPIEHIMIN